MGELEKLEIRINSTTTDATDKINSLIAKVGNLETAFTRIGNLNTTNLSNQLRVLGTSLQTFKQGGLTGRELTTIASGMQKIASVDSNGLRNTASAMQQVASAIQSINHAGFDATAFANISRSLNKLVPLSSASSNISILGASIRTFVNDLNTVPAVSFDATSLSNSINAISRLGGKNSRQATTTIPLLTNALRNFITEMNKVGDLQTGSENLYSLANAISVMGRKTSEKAISNIPQLTTALRDMMKTLSSAPKVSDNLINMTNALANLSSTGVKASGTVNSLSRNYRIFGERTKALKKHTYGLASTFGMLYAKFWIFMRAFRLLGSAVTYASDLVEVQNVIDNTFGVSTSDAINKNADAIQHLAKNTISWFGMSELSTKQIAGRYMAMGSAMGLANRESDGLSEHLSSLMGDMGKVTNKASEMALNITALAGDMASFYNVDAVEMSEKLASGVYSGQVRALRAYGLDLTMATLQEYALSKGITENVKNMTQAEKTLLRYNYVMDRTQNVQGDFVRTQGTWANQTRMLKQNLQQLGSVMGEVLIHAFKGLVTWTNKAILSFTAFAVSVANALGKIFGWEVEQSGGSTDISDLADDTEDLSDGLGNATDNAKKLKNVLQGFDKLNLITTPSDSGKGSGSGSDALADNLGDWNIKKTDNGLLKMYESDIVSLGDLGNMIQEKLADTLEKIDWKKIYLKAQGFGSGLANFLNGLLTPKLFAEIGETFAGGLNTVIYSGLSFVETFNWEQFGTAIATGVNKFFKDVDWASAGKTFGKGITGILTSVDSFLKKTNWKKVGKAFNTFIKNALKEISWKKLGQIVVDGYKAIMDFGGELTGLGGGFTVLATSVSVLFGAFKGFKAVSDATKAIKLMADTIKASALVSTLGKLGIGMSALGTAGILIGTAVGVTALGAIISYRVEVEKAKKQQELLNDAWGDEETHNKFKNTLEDVATDLETVKDRLADIQKEYETTISGGEGEHQYIDDLIDSYYNLQTQTNLTADEKKKMLDLSKQLVEYFPELAEFYDSETGLISKTKDEVKKLNDARLEEIKTSAMENLLKQEYEEYYKTLDDVTKSYESLQDAQDKLNEYTKTHEDRIRLARDAYNLIIPSTEDYAESINSVYKGSKLSSEKQKSLLSVLNRLNRYGWTTGKVKKYNDLIDDLKDGTIDSAESLDTLYDSVTLYSGAIQDTEQDYQDFITTQSGLIDEVKDADKAYHDSAKTLDGITDKIKQYGNEVGISDTKLKTANEYIKEKFPNASKVFDSVKKSAKGVVDTYSDMFKYNGKSVVVTSEVKNQKAVPNLLSGLKGVFDYDDDYVTIGNKVNGTSVNGLFGTIRSIFGYDDDTVTVYQDTETTRYSSPFSTLLDNLKKLFGYDGKTVSIFTDIKTKVKDWFNFNADGGVYANGTWKPVQQYAMGGVPDMGQMFIARESGPELVGSIGGHTAVMNNDQIVASVSNGVYQAVKSALGNGQNVNVQVVLEGDADGLFEVVQAKNNQYKKINGHSAL